MPTTIQQEIYTNFATTTLSSAASPAGSGTAGTLSFVTSSLLPTIITTGQIWKTNIEGEIVTITSVGTVSGSNTTYNVIRGSEGTAAPAHLAGAVANHFLTSGGLNNFAQLSADNQTFIGAPFYFTKPMSSFADLRWGRINLGAGLFDGSAFNAGTGTGGFVGSSNGTEIAINSIYPGTGNFLDFQVAGSSKWRVDKTGTLTTSGTLPGASITGMVPLASLSGITNTQLSGSAGITGANLANTGAAAQFYAGPTGAGGAVSARAIVAGDLPNTTVTPGTYNYASVTVNAQGQVIGASPGTAPITSITASSPLSSTGGTTPTLSIGAASASLPGYMIAADYMTLHQLSTTASQTYTFPSTTSTLAGLGVVNAWSNTNTFSSPGTTSIPLVAKGVTSQVADLQQWQDNTGAVLAGISSIGSVNVNGHIRPTNTTVPTYTNLNATSISSIAFATGSTDIAGAIILTIATNQTINANTDLCTILFTTPFINVPFVSIAPIVPSGSSTPYGQASASVAINPGPWQISTPTINGFNLQNKAAITTTGSAVVYIVSYHVIGR